MKTHLMVLLKIPLFAATATAQRGGRCRWSGRRSCHSPATRGGQAPRDRRSTPVDRGAHAADSAT